MVRWLVTSVGLSVAICSATPAFAFDSISLIAGGNDEKDRVVRVAVTREFGKRWPGEMWHGSAYWEASVGQLRSDASNARNKEVWDVGLTPVLRLSHDGESGAQPFLEAGVGAHLLSDKWLGDKNLGSTFHFGTHLGLGMRWPNVELMFRAQHLSNAGIANPNPGVNFYMAVLGWRF